VAAYPRRWNAVLVGAICAGLAPMLVGCGEKKDPDAGTNGIGKLSPAKIESRTLKVAKEANAVHLSGSVVTKGRTYKLDMRLKEGEGKEGGGIGRLSSKESSFEMLRVGDALYLKADADFWASQKGGQSSKSDSEAASKLGDKYVKVPSGDPAYKKLSGFTDMHVLLDGLLALHGKLVTGARGAVDGVRTIRIEGGGGNGGALDVALEGVPYPLRFQRAAHAGTVKFADWNKDFTLEAPDKNHIIDYGKKITTVG
jgi:hypothetical protein